MLCMVCGEGMNIWAELLIVHALLWFAYKKNIRCMHMFGDSKVDCDWKKNMNKLKEALLQHWCVRIEDLKTMFSSLTFTHIYRSHNK